MLDYTQTELQKVVLHRVGNPSNGEDLQVTNQLIDLSDSQVELMLFKYFLSPFSEPEFFSFTFSTNDFKLNPLYQLVQSGFEKNSDFIRISQDIAKYLNSVSNHPQIKKGELFVSYFTNVQMDSNLYEMIGIFKSESKQSILKINQNKSEFKLEYIDGLNVEKLDKACLIFNTRADDGYRVCMLDRSNKSSEAQYWKDEFLQLKPCNDDYLHTKEFLHITKQFVTQKLDEEFEVTKADKIDLLNRSVAYFKTHESFVKEEFEEQVLQDSDVIKSFRSFDRNYREANELEMQDHFEISNQAVKKQARVFKSVLKLDKNFHIYIHGNRNMIEQGVENDGRKFYKIYYNEET